MKYVPAVGDLVKVSFIPRRLFRIIDITGESVRARQVTGKQAGSEYEFFADEVKLKD